MKSGREESRGGNWEEWKKGECLYERIINIKKKREECKHSEGRLDLARLKGSMLNTKSSNSISDCGALFLKDLALSLQHFICVSPFYSRCLIARVSQYPMYLKHHSLHLQRFIQ